MDKTKEHAKEAIKDFIFLQPFHTVYSGKDFADLIRENYLNSRAYFYADAVEKHVFKIERQELQIIITWGAEIIDLYAEFKDWLNGDKENKAIAA